MSDCECMSNCRYFKDSLMDEFPLMLKLRQEQYCRGNNTTCARYMVFKALGKEDVPADLKPAQAERAKAIIDNARKG